jgi:fumarate reductase subunit D
MTNQSTETNTLMCILSYLGIFALIPYLTQKDDAYINWHARQGLLITAFAIVTSFGLGVLSLLPAIGWIASMISMLFSFAVLGLCVYCMIQACGGKKWRVPGIAVFLK